MSKKWYQILFSENNLIIVIPGIVVVLIVALFMVVGFQKPASSQVEVTETLIHIQDDIHAEIVELYNEKDRSDSSPLFILNPFEISPLTGLIMFETETVKSYMVVVKGKTEDADISYVTQKSQLHYIPVYGLYAGHNNVIELYEYHDHLSEAGRRVYSISIPTDKLDSRVELATSISTTKEYFGDDLMLLTPAYNSLPTAYDLKGDVRWYLTVPLAFAFDQLQNGHFVIGTDRIISDPYYTNGLYEMDLLGKIYKEYYIEGGYHHDVYEMDNGNLLVLTNDFVDSVEDAIVEIDVTTGDVVKSWSLKEYLNQLDGMSQMWTDTDWFHNNSIDYNENTGDMLLSGRHQDAVISINYITNEINWVLSDPEGWNEEFVADYFLTPQGENFEWSYAQHSAIFLDDNVVFLFDNGNNKSKLTENYVDVTDTYSRGVIYEINPVAMTISQRYQYGKERGTEFYSPYISNVFAYSDTNYLIHSGGIAYASDEGVLNYPAPLYTGDGVVELKSVTVEIENETVMYELHIANNYYRAVRINLDDFANSFSMKPAQVLGHQAVTKTSVEDINYRFNLVKTLQPKYDLSIVKESDRLVVEGMFDRNELIYLVLRNDSEELIYHIPTSRTPYTAMCIGVFQGDDRFLTFYVNEENIEGDFDIYLVINGREYDTYKEVTFN